MLKLVSRQGSPCGPATSNSRTVPAVAATAPSKWLSELNRSSVVILASAASELQGTNKKTGIIAPFHGRRDAPESFERGDESDEDPVLPRIQSRWLHRHRG